MTPEREALVDDVGAKADALAAALVAATEAGVPHPFILPRLMLAFRQAFGGEPPNIGEMMKAIGA